jgi:energy-converting hydrogenase Eha subunit E
MALTQHEMWRDEMEAWLLARDSDSIPQLFNNLRNEGHPGLWYVLLMPLTRLSHSPELMQVLHLGIATTTVYLVSRYSPLSRLQLLLFPLGFYTAWQYSVVSRNYALGVLLLTTFCVLYTRRDELFPLVGVVLMLAAHTHALVLILVIAIGIGLAVDMRSVLAQGQNELSAKRTRGIVVGFCLVVLGVITSFIQLVPDAHYRGPIDWVVRILRGHVSTIGSASLLGVVLFLFFLYQLRDRAAPLVMYGLGAVGAVLYFDSSVLGAIAGAPGIKLFALTGLLSYLFFLYQLRDRLSILLMYGLGTAGLLVFFSGVHSGGPHQHGLLFIALFVVYWLERLTRSKPPDRLQSRQNRTADVIFTLLLLSQSVFGMKALYQDLTTPYSNGKYAAQYIRSQGWQDISIVGCMDFAAQTVVGYLGVKKIYYPQGERWGSYVVWDEKRYENVGLDQCLRSARSLGRDVLVVSSYPDDSSLREPQFHKVAEFRGALRDDENFILYKYSPAGEPRL